MKLLKIESIYFQKYSLHAWRHQFNLNKTTFSIKANFLIWKYEACNNNEKLVIENLVPGPKYYWRWSIPCAEMCLGAKVSVGPKWSWGLTWCEQCLYLKEITRHSLWWYTARSWEGRNIVNPYPATVHWTSWLLPYLSSQPSDWAGRTWLFYSSDKPHHPTVNSVLRLPIHFQLIFSK